jgi:2-methylcitrate dehydratase PrpD
MKEREAMDVLGTMIEFCLDTELADVPDDVVAESALSFANTAGVALGGLSSDAAQVAMSAVTELGGNKQAHIFGTGIRSSVDRVAFVNAVAAHVLDFDDTHLPTVYHPTATLFGAGLALSELRQVSGEEFLAMWTVGVELGTRVAIGLGREHYDAGWHITATAGAVAAAFVSGRAMGLGSDQMRHCVGIAAAQASGHRAHFGSMMKSGQVGAAASVGAEASLLAKRGFTASEDALVGPRGLMHTAAPAGDPSALASELGSKWLVSENRLKPYASGVVTHPIIDLGRQVKESGIDIAAIESVRLLVHPLVTELTGNLRPTMGLEGKFSAVHCFSVGAILGHGGPPAFSDEIVTRSDIVALRDTCELMIEADRLHMTAAAQVDTGGQLDVFEVSDSRGGFRRPLTAEEVRDKFKSVTTSPGLLQASDADLWFERLTSVRSEPSMAVLVSDAASLGHRG